MARTFGNSTAQTASFAVNLSASLIMYVSLWARFPSYNTGITTIAFAYDNAAGNGHDGIFFAPTGYSSTLAAIATSDASGNYWRFGFPRPSAGVWHHYLFGINRNNGGGTLSPMPFDGIWIDGVAPALTVLSNPGHFNARNYGNQSIWLGSDGAPPGNLLCPGDYAECAGWNGINNPLDVAKSLAAGANPLGCQTPNINWYIPLYGAPGLTANEQNVCGWPLATGTASNNGPKVVLTGSCPIVNHPPVQGFRLGLTGKVLGTT